MLSVRRRYMVWVPECYRQPVSVSWGLHSCTQCLPGCVLWHWHTWYLCIEHVLKCRLGKSMFCLENEKAVFWTRPYFEHRFLALPQKEPFVQKRHQTGSGYTYIHTHTHIHYITLHYITYIHTYIHIYLYNIYIYGYVSKYRTQPGMFD